MIRHTQFSLLALAVKARLRVGVRVLPVLVMGRRQLWLRTSQVWLVLFCGLLASKAHASKVSILHESTHPDVRYVATTWDARDGFPDNSATSMVQTPDGYLWIGTFHGLARFDGVKFTVFNQRNVPELRSDAVINLHLDAMGRLWASTDKAIACLQDGRWTSHGPAEGWTGNDVRTFAEGAGKLFVTSSNGKVFEFKQGRFQKLPEPPGLPRRMFGHVDGTGQFWLAKEGFFGFWREGRWHPVRPPGWLGSIEVGAGPARHGGWWVHDEGRLRKFVGSQLVEDFQVRIFGFIWSLSEDNEGVVWINTTDNGLFRVSPGQSNQHFLNGLPTVRTRFVFEDREGNHWVGTDGGGLMRLKPSAGYTFGREHGLSEPRAMSLALAPTGEVWVGTFGAGVVQIKGQTVTPFQVLPKSLKAHVTSVLSDRTERLWIGISEYLPWREGLYLKARNNLQAIEIENPVGPSITALFEDSQGRVWIAGDRTVGMFKDGKFTRYQPAEGGPGFFAVSAFAEDRATGSIWYGDAEPNLYRYEHDRFAKVITAGDVLTAPIRSLLADADGALWIGTQGDALARLYQSRITIFDEARGLPVRMVGSVIDGEDGNLWLGTELGIIRVSRSELTAVAEGRRKRVGFLQIDQHDGLVNPDCSTVGQPAAVRDLSGRLWFATMNGVAVIDPRLARLNPNPSFVHIESIQFLSEEGSQRKVDASVRWAMSPPGKTHGASANDGGHFDSGFPNPIRLVPGSRHLKIHYTAPTFSAPDETIFQVKLEPGDTDWQDVGHQRVIDYVDLPPGSYTFQVRAANTSRIWSESVGTVAVTALPHFWETLWFKALCLAVLASLTYASFRWRLMRQKKEYAAQQAFTREIILSQEKERKRVASELHDGLCQDLVLIKGRLALAATRQSDAAEHARQLDAAAAATTRAIEEVRAISHAMWPTALEQLGLTKAIESMVAQLGEGSATSYVAELDNIDGLLAPEMEMNLFRIIQEGLKNVIRHAGASQVILELKRADSGLRMSLFDNGKGFDVDKLQDEDGARHGLGLASINERVRYLAGSLALQSAPGRGTRLTVGVPLTRTKGLKA